MTDKTDTDSVKAAYDAGYAAYPDKSCPYEPDSVLWNAWWDGRLQCDYDSAFWY